MADKMIKLPLYAPDDTTPEINRIEPLTHDLTCTRCKLHEKSKTVCMRPEGEEGGVLVVADMPGKIEDQLGRPFSGSNGKYMRRLIAGWWKGPVAYTAAVGCAPGMTKVTDRMIDACRPYNATTIQDVQPTRIICLGSAAIASIFGRRPPIMSVRGGWSWWVNEEGMYVPVFFTVNPAAAMRNRFMARAFESDLKWALTCDVDKLRPHFDGVTHLVNKTKDAARAEAELLQQEWIAYDVETFGMMGNSDFRLEAVTLLGKTSPSAFTWTREGLTRKGPRRALKRILERTPLVTQNGKYDDRAVLCGIKARVRHIEGDTRLLSKLLDFNSSASLDVMAEKIGMGGHKSQMQDALSAIVNELNYQAFPPAGLTPMGKVRKIRPPKFHVEQSVLDQLRAGAEPMAFAMGYVGNIKGLANEVKDHVNPSDWTQLSQKLGIPIASIGQSDTLYKYNARDVYTTRASYKRLLPQMAKHPNLEMVWKEIVAPANRALRWVEYWGVGVDKQALEQFSDHCKAQITISMTKLQTYAPDLNPQSPIQLREFLFNKLRLPVVKLTDTDLASTDAEVLEELRDKHPAVEHLLSFRKFSKLNGTYAEGMLRHVRQDGRIHATYLLDGAGTGRLSSAEPNMQNRPRSKGNPEGKMLNDCFVAEPDWLFAEFDQGQIELRVAAMLSQDKNMIADFKAGIDIHSNNARELCELAWGIPQAKWDKMTADERDPYRSMVKTTTFGRLYGKTDAGLAKEFGVSVQVISKINQRIWGRYAQLNAWIKKCVMDARGTGDTYTYWRGQKARRRAVWEIASSEDDRRAHAERTAYNTSIQGTAADFTTASLWPIVSWILKEKVPARLVCTVHDSVTVEMHKSVQSDVIAKVKEIMTGHYSWGVPLIVDCKVGDKLGSMEKAK